MLFIRQIVLQFLWIFFLVTLEIPWLFVGGNLGKYRWEYFRQFLLRLIFHYCLQFHLEIPK